MEVQEDGPRAVLHGAVQGRLGAGRPSQDALGISAVAIDLNGANSLGARRVNACAPTFWEGRLEGSRHVDPWTGPALRVCEEIDLCHSERVREAKNPGASL